MNTLLKDTFINYLLNNKGIKNPHCSMGIFYAFIIFKNQLLTSSNFSIVNTFCLLILRCNILRFATS